MRRDWDLIRDILLRVADNGDPGPVPEGECPRYGRHQRHIELTKQAGFIIDRLSPEKDPWPGLGDLALTKKGHDLMHLIHSDDRWAHIKALATECDLRLIEETIPIFAKYAECIERAYEATRIISERTLECLNNG